MMIGLNNGLTKTMSKKMIIAVGTVLRKVTNGRKNTLNRSKTPPRTPKRNPTSKLMAIEIKSLKTVPPIAS